MEGEQNPCRTRSRVASLRRSRGCPQWGSRRPEDASRGPAAAPRPAGGFPPGFLWGTATSSYQVEGAVNRIPRCSATT
ncbi:family 1 glycosylhydrolase [Bradyrhizobium sp. UFLA05-109]